MIEKFFDNEFILETITSVLTTLSPPSQTNAVSLTFDSSNVGVRVGGFTTGSGDVVLQGDISETLTFPVNGELYSLNNFTSISTIIVNNLINEASLGKIEIYLSTPAGAPKTFRTEQGTYRGRVSNRKRTFQEVSSGLEVTTNPILFTTWDIPVTIKDYIRVVGRTFEVSSISYPSDLLGNINHQECELRELEGT